MTNLRITDSEKDILKKLIGRGLSYIGIPKPPYNCDLKIYGNALLVATGMQVEIRNEETPEDYFGVTEDVARFFVDLIDEKNPFHLMAGETIMQITAASKIIDVILAEDYITVEDMESRETFEFEITEGIIIKTDVEVYSFSNVWQLMELMYFVKLPWHEGIENTIKPVRKVIEEWGDDDNCRATCERKFISLKDNSEIQMQN